MKRTLSNTGRKVRIVIDNFHNEAFDAWSAGASVDGVIVTYEVSGTSPTDVLAKISVALERGGDLDDALVPVPEQDKAQLLVMLKAIFETWGHASDIPDWRDNEYLRGQLELVIEMCRVVTDEEYGRGDGDIDQQRDRITDWLKARVWL
jgi:hypothetical protein